ncbi:NADH-quinone oxidoreductase subunit N [Nonomuraea roseoviolacea]|uniref:NADH-quinone oxidoreductase subunit N n=1 Tax=Nonomuraea roseoviolacea subsp. carminata TaxID=160689 RepID=A0ABT1JY33_9ACTN|nr:NADH-quinone oxidoreductase subunit N [Nonomuraea roseoviolacea]MCP2346665.1 NADH-quinone oxidoreductase subunit N [Nonomuraea roseoviolacea subsp. carminata]
MIQQIDYFVIAPPLVLAVVAGLVLLLDAFLPAGPRVRTGLGLTAIGGVVVALGFVVAQSVRLGQTGQDGQGLATFCVPGSLVRAVSGTGPTGASQTGDASQVAGASRQAAALCSFVADRFTLVVAGLVLVAALVVVLMSMSELAAGAIPAGEWYFLLLCVIIGAVTLPASRDLVMLVVALELVSLPVFALTALKRYDGRASEAAVKLFVVSVVSTAIMLFGVSLLYGIGGTVYLSRLADIFSGAVPAPGLAGSSSPEALAASPASGVITVGVVLVLAGFAFKIAAVPFHAWAPDVYQGAPVPVAALLSVISKAAGFAGLILLLTTALSGQSVTWTPVVAVIAALTMTVGNLLALRQRSAVRLLAWSSVAQSGYILAPLAVAAQATERVAAAGSSGSSSLMGVAGHVSAAGSWTGAAGQVSEVGPWAGPVSGVGPWAGQVSGVGPWAGPVSGVGSWAGQVSGVGQVPGAGSWTGHVFGAAGVPGAGVFGSVGAQGGEVLVSGPVGASLAYLVIYAAMNLGAFAVVMLVSRTSARNELDDYRGLAYRSPVAGLSLAFCLVCLAGLPPGLAGLFAKVVVFREIVNGGAGWLAVVMAVNTVIGLYYYVAWAARVLTPAPAPIGRRAVPATWVAVGLAVAITVMFSVAPQLVFDLTS